MRATMLSVFVLSMFPASAGLLTSSSAAAADGGERVSGGERASGGERSSIDADEPAPSPVSGADVAASVEGDSIASCVVSCPGGDKSVSCSEGVCQCYCDPGGKPICKCG